MRSARTPPALNIAVPRRGWLAVPDEEKPLGDDRMVAGNAARAIQPAQTMATESGNQVLDLSVAIVLQVFVFLAIFFGILLFFYLRRRRQSSQRGRKESTDQSNTSPDEIPYVGYRATILGISRDRSKQGNGDRGTFDRPDKPTRGGSWQTTSCSDPAELPSEATRFSIQLSFNNMIHSYGSHAASNNGKLAVNTPEHHRKASDNLSQTSTDAVSVSNMRVQKWLPEVPQRMLSRPHSIQNRSLPPTPIGTPAYPHSPAEFKVPAATPTLKEIHDRLTTSELEIMEPPPTALFNDDYRWSATTRSSNFTAYSARSSGTAFVSALKPPPIPKTRRMETLSESPIVPDEDESMSSPGAATVQVGRPLITEAPKGRTEIL